MNFELNSTKTKDNNASFCLKNNIINKDCNKLILNNELQNSEELKNNPEENEYLYPTLNDPNFNIKIAKKKEFSDTKYDGTIRDIKDYVDKINNSEFELSPHQAFTRNFMSFQTPYNSLLLYHGLGSGKCHAKGTPIMMSDGTIKLVENILEGEFLMGDDSKPRKVLSLARGKDKMYTITQFKGDKYTVNQEHILCLKDKTNKIIEISVNDYLNLPEENKVHLKGYKVEIEFPDKCLPVNPYIVGLLYIDEYNITKIHHNYKCNSTYNRLELLGGIIDAFGSYNSTLNQFVIEVKSETLSNDILFIVRSLGFYGVLESELENRRYKIFISGELSKIHSKEFKYNKNIIDSDKKDVLLTEIDVKYVGEDEYFGFTLDGNGRYVMEDFTVTHNTCSAIGVAEEMRDYLNQMGITKKIIIVASPNVQDNFKLQLFDERKLKLVDGIWTIKGCIGNKLLKEINPTNMKGLTKEKVINEVKNLINISYSFMGYTQFSNKITKTAGEGKETIRQKNLQQEFNNSLIIIDEVHNMRISDDNENATAAKNLMYLVTVCQNIRLLLLSATPMFNNYKEIIWLINLMNINDKRAFVNIKDIFDKDGNFRKNKDGYEIGKELLIRKVTGYISYVRGDNPYTFPFRIYPDIFAPEHTFQSIQEYPKYQLNCKKIPNDKKINKVSLYLNKIGDIQNLGYQYVMNRLRKQEQKNFLEKDTFGYTDLQIPLECLNIVYPVEDLENIILEPCEFNNEEASNSELEIIPNYDEADLEEDNNVPAILDELSSQTQTQTQTQSSSNKTSNKTSNKSSNKSSTNSKSKSKSNRRESTLIDSPIQSQTQTEIASTTPIQSQTEIASSSKQSQTEIASTTPIQSQTQTEIATPSLEQSQTQTEIATPSLEQSQTEIASSSLKQSQAETEIATPSDLSSLEEFEIEVPIKSKKKNNKQVGGINIDYRLLTGSLGLSNIMKYTDSISPAQKGSFEYKNKHTNNRIFSPKEIGKYSCKIKSICESIYNSQTNTVGKGIILIYSAYIDAGLIPLALALEEMGFVRYQNSKAAYKTPSLFTNPPTEQVDVRTMKPKTDGKNNTDFKPAKYIMITGDPRLSPNNDLDVKAITSDDNIDGSNIKVVLISQAGSEGLDFKAVRQTHIMEPWYNMNRIEQITGRAVRNLSHKDLPLEERNVEIFLHGTILDNPEEESVDLYIYRVAEIKAVQIGKITRLLKQTSVDCLINHEQSEFTTENFKKIKENKNITQMLSDGKVIKHFEVGDVPNSAMCDYMETCEYKCLPEISIDKLDVNFDSYSEKFMIVNSDKIIQRIRELMKERYFYTKKELFSYLNTPKSYPTSQIYAALTQMISDSSEYILDKYGRTGYLINIGEYYLFQPSELNYNNISIYDRSVPIDYKHNMIKININEDLIKGQRQRSMQDELKDEPKDELKDDESKDESRDEPRELNDESNELRESKESNKSKGKSKNKNQGNSILNEMIVNYDLAMSTNKVSRGEENWYKYCGVVINKLQNEGESREFLEENLIEHMIESLMYNEKIELLNYLNIDCSNSNSNELLEKERNKLVIKIKSYFCKQIIYNKNITGIILFDGSSRINNIKVFILKNKQWKSAEPEDIRDLTPIINEKYKIKFNLNTFVGFIGFEDKNKYMIFKVKDTSRPRNSGSRCDQAGKKKTLDVLNDIIGSEKYTKENTKGVVQQELCILQEFILRNYEREHKDGKTWFLTNEMAIINEFF